MTLGRGRLSPWRQYEAGGTVPSLVERSALLILRGAPPADVAELGAMSLRTAYRWRRDLVAIETVRVDGWEALFARRRRRPPIRMGPWERVTRNETVGRSVALADGGGDAGGAGSRDDARSPDHTPTGAGARLTDEAPPPVRPGYCSDHPNQRLVSHKVAGIRWFGRPIETVCPMPDHDDNNRERCRWCGGPLHLPGEIAWKASSRREFCTANHRLRAFRERTKR